MPISKKQKQILAFPYTHYGALICDGAVRSGKTSFMILAFVDDAMRRYDRQRFAICGKTVESAVKNIVEPFLGVKAAREKYNVNWRKADKTLVVTRGKKQNIFEVFGGKDESSFTLIQGRTLAGVLFDEVALQTRSFVEQALARCSVEGSRFWFNCNPDSPNHWFYREWLEKAQEHNALHLHFELDDNPSLSDEIKERYRTMYSGVFYQRYVLGLWVAADGIIYPQFNREKHIVKSKPRNYSRYYVSIDYGTSNPTSMGLWGFYAGKWYRVADSYHDGRENAPRTDEEHYKELKRLVKGNIPGESPISRIRAVIVDPSAASFIQTIKRHGEFVVKPANNDVIEGIANTATELDSGRLLFCDCCHDIFREFGSYVWDKKASERGEDKPVKQFDHCLTGDTLVCTSDGEKPIKELVGKRGTVWSLNTQTGKAELKPFEDVRMTQKEAQVYRIMLEDGREIRCTGEHPILTDNGYIQAKYLKESDNIVDAFNDYESVADVKIEGKEPVYNMEVEDNHNFAVNGGLIVHNCMDDMRYFVNTILYNHKGLRIGGI